ncbi:hypothetical protein ACV3J7_20820 [Salmonella enterica]
MFTNLLNVVKASGCDVQTLILNGDRLPRLQELVKIVPALEKGEIKEADVLKYIASEKQANPDNGYLSSATLHKWRLSLADALKANEGDMQAAVAMVDGAAGKRGVKKGNNEQTKVQRKVEQAVSSIPTGMVLVTALDAYVVAELKKRDAAHYSVLALQFIEDQKAEIKARLEAEMQERLAAELVRLEAALPDIQKEEPVATVNPSEIKEQPVFTPEPLPEVKPETKKTKKISDDDFLDLIKHRFLENNFEMTGEESNRLVELKEKGNKDAIDLLAMTESE